MNALNALNTLIALLFLLCYAYQFAYIPLVWLRKPKAQTRTPRENRFAFLICARNEAAVIGDLLDSIHAQTYDQSLLRVFVMADNCTDNTAEIAAQKGARVYTRFDKTRVGKGYALEALRRNIRRDYPEGFDGYFVFDADNVLMNDYVERMNATFSQGNAIVTSYRNSKNYGDNWISAGYGLWFLRESKYLHYARTLLGTSCNVSGTGFLFGREVSDRIGDWPFHTLTEDIEFSIDQIIAGEKITFCPDAEFFDEQPRKFSQSWHQRLRWSKGYLQVFGRYGGRLARGVGKGSFSCFDMCMTIMPAYILSAISIVCNLFLCCRGLILGGDLRAAAVSILGLVLNMGLTVFAMGAVTTLTEWKKIHASPVKKLLYMFTFPLFMLTYVPISLAALFWKGEWKPIAHTVTLKDGSLLLPSRKGS